MNLSELQTLGAVFTKSGFFADTRDAAQAVVKVMAGMELGFPPIASMTGVYIVKGKVSLSANLMAAAIKKSSKYNYRVRQLDEKGCKLEFFEDGESVGFSEFTKADANNAGLGGDTWKKFFRNMAFARAMSNGAKWYCADIFGGPIYTPEELGADVDAETGEVLDMPVEVAMSLPALPDEPEPIEAEPEPLRNVKLEGAQPPINTGTVVYPSHDIRNVKLEGGQPQDAPCELPEGLQGPAALVVELAKKLKWNEADIIAQIQQAFGEVVYPGALKSYLELASKDQLRELYRAINSQGKRRN